MVRLIFAVIVVLWAVFATATLFTKLPITGEGVYAAFGRNLFLHGRLANPVLDASQARWTGVDRADFWTMPLHPLVQAAWYRLFGFSLSSLRSLSLIMGFVALLALFRIIRHLCGDAVALLGAAFVAMDRNFVLSSAIGRPDMMSLAFALLALDVYLSFRLRRFPAAIWLSSTCAAISFFAHPVGGILGFGGLAYLALRFDRSQLRPVHLLLAALPFLAGASAYAAYAAANPSSFLPMLHQRLLARLWSFASPVQGLRAEFHRYLLFFGFNESDSGLHRIKFVFLLGYAVGVGGLIFIARRLRDRGAQTVLALLALSFCTLWLVEGSKQKVYLMYISFLLSLALALTCIALYRSKRSYWKAAAAFLCLIPLMQEASLLRLGLTNNLSRYYWPAGAILNASRNGTVFAGSALLFAIRPGVTLIDDDTLGFYNGKTADAVAFSNLDTQDSAGPQDPAAAAHVRELMEKQYQCVLENTAFRVCVRRAQ